MKTVLLSSQCSHEEKQRSCARALANNDDDPAGGAALVVLSVPITDAQITATTEPPHRPWRFQGMRNAVKRTGVEEHSIVELLDDSIAKLLMKSDGVDRCVLQLELTQMARSHAGMRAENCDG